MAMPLISWFIQSSPLIRFINGLAIRDLFQKTLHIKLQTPKWTIIFEQVDTPLFLKQSRNSSVGRVSGHMMIIIGQLQK